MSIDSGRPLGYLPALDGLRGAAVMIFFYCGTLNGAGHVPGSSRVDLAWTLTFATALTSYFLVERRALAYKERFRAARADDSRDVTIVGAPRVDAVANSATIGPWPS